MSRKNIKLPEPLFNALRDDKPDHMSWPTYFETRCLAPDDADTVTLDATERTKLVRAIADELAEGRR
jgi:hypothetical protein